jgi:tetratricopeptide (TPR) repeat protein
MSGTLVSLCVIVKNEERFLDRSLSSVSHLVDEIIIVDTGSTDNTVSIAQRFTDKVHHFKWINDFSAARNFAQSKASSEYIFRWDADWLFDSFSEAEFIKLKTTRFGGVNTVFFNWGVTINELEKPTSKALTDFIYKRDSFHWVLPIHELLVLNDNTVESTNLAFPNIYIQHLKDFGNTLVRTTQNLELMSVSLSSMSHTDFGYFRILKNYIAELYLQGKFEETVIYAEQYLNQFDDDSDNTATVLDFLITSLLRTHQVQSAHSILEIHHTRFQDLKRFHICCGDVELTLQNYIKAIEEYTKALLIDVEGKGFQIIDDERLEIHPRLMLAQLYFDQQLYNLSYQYANEIIQISQLQSNITTARQLILEIQFLQSI